MRSCRKISSSRSLPAGRSARVARKAGAAEIKDDKADGNCNGDDDTQEWNCSAGNLPGSKSQLFTAGFYFVMLVHTQGTGSMVVE
jgi:hypothetical protein